MLCMIALVFIFYVFFESNISKLVVKSEVKWIYLYLEDKWMLLYYTILFNHSKEFKTQLYRIPKVCYQTWVTKNLSLLTHNTLQVMRQNQQLNPDIQFELWDDNDVDQFIKSEFPGDVYRAYRTINPLIGAAKADFFRYCVIYKNGGIYLDLKSSFKVPSVFGNIILPDDRAILDIRREDKMLYRSEWHYGSYEQWFLMFEPNHPYLEKMIAKMTRDILGRVAFHNVQRKEEILRLTGPDAYAAAIHEAIVQYGVLHREVSYHKWLRYFSRADPKDEYRNMNLTKYARSTAPLYREESDVNGSATVRRRRLR